MRNTETCTAGYCRLWRKVPGQRGGKSEKLEGNWEPDRVVILEFESLETAKKFINSPEYSEARALRHKTASSNMIVVEAL